MKFMKLLVPLFVIFISFFFTSCKEDFSPKIEYSEQYIVYAVFASNVEGRPASLQVVVAKTYDVDGYNPNTNTIDPLIANAEVSITIKDKVYPFVPDSIRRMDTTRYKDKMHYYSYFDNIFFLKSNDVITITAKLPNGKVLSAVSKVPPSLLFDYSYDFSFGFSADLNRLATGETWDISWDNSESGHLYTPQLLLHYTITNDSGVIYRTKEIPCKYVHNKAIYPSSSFDNFVSYDYSAIDAAIASISEGDADKSKYKMGDFVLAIVDYNPPLAKFYSSTHGSLDEYSIRLDETTYSNISGGLGVFGIYKTNPITFYLRASYIKKFGYR
ncbi:MAG: DUF4249 family protein [Bacteroidota bacterium]|nr:DUF4249 family protein [Bacteroidota bacterium]